MAFVSYKKLKLKKYPVFLIQYQEYDKKIGFATETSKIPFSIDGLFEPFACTTGRLSLGTYVELDRRPETLDYLVNLGLGIHFFLDDENNLVARSYSKQPIYLFFNKKHYKLDMGEIVAFYNLTSIFEHKILPKKVGKVYDEFSIKVSFGEEFKKVDNSGDQCLVMSPCWCDLSLNRIVNSSN